MNDEQNSSKGTKRLNGVLSVLFFVGVRAGIAVLIANGIYELACAAHPALAWSPKAWNACNVICLGLCGFMIVSGINSEFKSIKEDTGNYEEKDEDDKIEDEEIDGKED